MKNLFLAAFGRGSNQVTPKTRNPFMIMALSISGVTWKWHFLNHAQDFTSLPLYVSCANALLYWQQVHNSL